MSISAPGESGPIAGRARHARSGRPGGPRQGRSQHRHRQPKACPKSPPSGGTNFWRKARGAAGRRFQGQRSCRQECHGGFGESQSRIICRLWNPSNIWWRRSTASSPAARWMWARWCWWERPAPRRSSPSPTKPNCASMCACRRPTPGPLAAGMTANFTVPELPGRAFHREARGQRRGGGQFQRHAAAAVPGRQSRGPDQAGRLCRDAFRPSRRGKARCMCPPRR